MSPEPSISQYITTKVPNLTANRTNQKVFTVLGTHTAIVGTITTNATVSGVTAPCYLVNGTTGEIVYAEGISGATFTSCTRGADGSNSQPMATGEKLYYGLMANDINQIIREILAIASAVPVLATGAEIITGTDDAKFATAKALKDAGIPPIILINSVPHKQFLIANASPTVTAGCAASAQIEMATNKNVYNYLAFDPAAIEYAYANVILPQDYTGGVVYAKFYWTHPATTVNFLVAWGLSGVAITDNGVLDVAQGTPQYANDTGGTTSNLYISGVTAAITIAGTPTANKACNFRLLRLATDATNDTLAVDAYFLWAVVYYPVA